MAGEFKFGTIEFSESIVRPGDGKNLKLSYRNASSTKTISKVEIAFYSVDDVLISNKYTDYDIGPNIRVATTNVYFSFLNIISESRKKIKLVGIAYDSNNSEMSRDAIEYDTFYERIPCYPSIATFDIWRINSDGDPDDTGVNLGISAKIEFENESQGISWTVTLEYQGENVSGSIDLTEDLQDLIGGIYNDVQLLSAYTFTNGEDIEFTLRIFDITEEAKSTDTIFRAFSNVHLSGAANGGVAFGRFSSSDDTHPKFECEYPAYFYGLVEAMRPQWELLTPSSGFNTFGTGTDPSYGNGKLRIGKIGSHVFVRGSVRKTSTAANGTICIIPEKYRPVNYDSVTVSSSANYDWFWFCPCSGSYICRINMSDNGELRLEWMVKISDASTVKAANNWIQLNIDWWINDIDIE